MNEHARLLYNMSVPPRAIIKYAGLATTSGSVRQAPGNVFGCFVAFRLPKGMRVGSAASILKRLGEAAGPDAEETLLELIERRAKELPLPGGCVVKRCKRSHPSPWPDPLSALAILTKSSANVWLRGKTPSLSSPGKRRSVSLLLPPAFAARILEVPQ